MLGVYVPCGYLLITSVMRRFGRTLRCLGCPGSTGNAFSWEMASRTPLCIQRNAWSSVHVMRQSTKFFVYVGTDPEVDSPALAGVFNAPDPFSRPLVSGSHWFGFRRRSTGSNSALLGSTADTCTSSVSVVFKDRFYCPDSAENCRVTQVQFLDMVICPLSSRTVEVPQIQLIAWICITSTRLGSRACRYAATRDTAPIIRCMRDGSSTEISH